MVRLFHLEVLLLKIYPTETFVHIGKDMHKVCLMQLMFTNRRMARKIMI